MRPPKGNYGPGNWVAVANAPLINREGQNGQDMEIS